MPRKASRICTALTINVQQAMRVRMSLRAHSHMKILLISTYELGRQPFGLASPVAWLRARGHHVSCLDLTREALQEDGVITADLISFYVPMHTATRLAAGLIPKIAK